MHIGSRIRCLFTLIFFCRCALALTATAAQWPPLPERDGQIVIPAQEWPHQPGPREVKVYIHYPNGALDQVGPGTGLMLTLHNWGGTGARGTADPQALAGRYDVIAIAVDYLQSGPYEIDSGIPYDCGYLQALDALRALYSLYHGLDVARRPFDRTRLYATGGSGGGNVALMANKLAPRTFACIVDMCGMAKLSDDIAFGLPGGTLLNAGYIRDPDDPRHLSEDAQLIRFLGYPPHAAVMKQLGCAAKIIVVHGANDDVCPVADAREMATGLREAGLHVEPHFITESDLDGKVLTSSGHPLGDRTRIVFRFADQYLLPASPKAAKRPGPSDFERPADPVRYPTPNGAYVIDYAEGYPVARFEPTP